MYLCPNVRGERSIYGVSGWHCYGGKVAFTVISAMQQLKMGHGCQEIILYFSKGTFCRVLKTDS